MPKCNAIHESLTAWNGETYTGLGEYYESVKNHEIAEDLDHDEILRLAIYGWNANSLPNGQDWESVLSEEQDYYYGENESEADFTENLTRETTNDLDSLPDWIVIDWQASWDSALRYDFFTYDVIDIDGNYRKFFWRNG